VINITENNLVEILENCFNTDQNILNEGLEIGPEIVLKHEEIVKNIIDNFGFISIEKYGADAFIHMCLLVQHLNNTPENILYREKYLKLFEQNKLDPKTSDLATLEMFNDYYALQVDRLMIHQGKKQKYGTQLFYDPELHKFVSDEVEDPDNLNKRRKELHLSSIEEYIKGFEEYNQ
jgi:hypothetical protein